MDLSAWHLLQRIFEGTQDETKYAIVLRTLSGQPIDTSPSSRALLAPLGPTIQTRSAFGILKTGTQYYQTILIVTPDRYAEYVANAKNTENPFYYGLPGEEHRHYLLIVKSPTTPSARPYAIYFDRPTGFYFYIRDDDTISKESFDLLNLFITIQSAPASPPPTPTPTISLRPGKAGS